VSVSVSTLLLLDANYEILNSERFAINIGLHEMKSREVTTLFYGSPDYHPRSVSVARAVLFSVVFVCGCDRMCVCQRDNSRTVSDIIIYFLCGSKIWSKARTSSKIAADFQCIVGPNSTCLF